jgi:hypothetical protein
MAHSSSPPTRTQTTRPSQLGRSGRDVPDLLDRVIAEIERRRDELRPSVKEYERLRAAEEAWGIRRLASATSIARATLATTVSKLVRDGLLQRVELPDGTRGLRQPPAASSRGAAWRT